MKIVIRPEAAAEWREACLFHDERRPHFGTKLNARILEALERIVEQPGACSRLGRKARCHKVRGFQYNVIFSIHGDEIVVDSIFHTSRNPRVWKSRLKS